MILVFILFVSSFVGGKMLHFRSTFRQPTLLSRLLMDEMSIDLARAHYLLDLGAVYLQQSGDRKTKRVLEEAVLSEGDYVRVFVEPRRYAIPELQVLGEDEHFLIVDKPSGFPW